MSTLGGPSDEKLVKRTRPVSAKLEDVKLAKVLVAGMHPLAARRIYTELLASPWRCDCLAAPMEREAKR